VSWIKRGLPSPKEALAEGIEREIDPFGAWYCEPHQDGLWTYLRAGGLRACVVWHRRAGKDDVALHWTCEAMCRRVGNYWHMLPQAEQARKAIWDAINPHTGRRRIDEAFPLELRKRTRHNEMMIEFKNGSIWQVVGSDNFNALVGSPPVGIVFSEFSLADPAAWAYLRPILRENGGWAVFVYTPRGRNHGLALYESAKRATGWFHQSLNALQTDVFSAAELEEERLELIAQFGEEMGQAYFDQEYMVSFDAANIGAIYARALNRLEQAGKICPLGWDPDYPVNTAWDFGYSDAASIWWFQIVPGPQLSLIDHYRVVGATPQHLCERIHGRLIEFDAAGKIRLGAPIPKHEHRAEWSYAKHYVPHDGANKTLAAGGRSIGDQCYAMDVNMTVIPATDQAQQISAARKTLEYCAFDMERCAGGIDALRSYHFQWDEKARRLSEMPVHDWSSHDADAFEIIGQVWAPLMADKPKEAPRFLHEATADEVFWPKYGKVNKWNNRRERI
jgi:phage terminase large subunit